MTIKSRLSKLERSPALRPAPELTLILSVDPDEKEGMQQARDFASQPGPLKIELKEVTRVATGQD